MPQFECFQCYMFFYQNVYTYAVCPRCSSTMVYEVCTNDAYPTEEDVNKAKEYKADQKKETTDGDLGMVKEL